MDIPRDEPERDRDRKKENPIPSDRELYIAGLTGELIVAHGQTSVLQSMRESHEMWEKTEQLNRDGRKEPSKIEQFLTNDNPSHLTKIANLEAQIAKSRRTVEILDETDFSGKSLYDFVPKEIQEELKEQLEGLKDWESIKETIEGEIGAACGEVWDDYKTKKGETKKARKDLLESLLLGNNPPEGEKKGLQSSWKQITEVEGLGELIGLERTRLVVRALNATPRDYPEKAADAEKILGKEFGWIAEQVAHMENCLDKDSIENTDGINLTEGVDLLCPALAEKMEKNEDGTPRIAPEQLLALEEAYLNASAHKGDGETPQDRTSRKISFVLAASEILERGKQATLANTLKAIREMEAPEKSDVLPPPLPEEEKSDLSKKIREKGIGKIADSKKEGEKGVGKIVAQWPQALFLMAVAKLWKGNLDLDGKHFGPHEQFVEYMKANLGEVNMA